MLYGGNRRRLGAYMTERKKSKAIAVYVDPKYEDKLTYIKYTVGITKFVEQALDKLKIDEDKMATIKAAEALKK